MFAVPAGIGLSYLLLLLYFLSLSFNQTKPVGFDRSSDREKEQQKTP